MITAKALQQLFNQELTTGELPCYPKNGDVTPVFKKNNPLNKETYKARQSSTYYCLKN